ncbi:AraC family transcriptional regulator [Streptomyces roseirectus]|uniref:AraC family transcriptional regulator n=1 Tax=Streptomyces roseirectus TaxID=2768066 RepID=A0A7H0I6B7_9ACTN|nr:AraC family transcriptional regulator [Streptomyces roseirectus]QNP68333.1 AraC family transcriptional regulator [Streptomyces roseirectus]
MGKPKDLSTFWMPPVNGVEVLHAHFRQHQYPRHTHEAATVALMDSGAASFLYRGEIHTAAAGDVFLINPGEVHTGWLAHPQGYRYRVLYLGAGALEQFHGEDPADPGRRSRPPAFRETVVQDARLAALLDRTHHALKPASPGADDRLLQEELFAELGQVLGNWYAEPGSTGSGPGPKGGNRAVSVAREYLESRLAEKVSLLELAGVACVSPFRLSRLFNAELGMPPHAFQILLRVKQARRLLAGGGRAVDIAREVGFYDQAHLNRVFKRYTGVTPHQFMVGATGSAGPAHSPRLVEEGP